MNLNQNFKILFWLKKKKANKKGSIPIYCRITIDGGRDEFSVNRQVTIDEWNEEDNVPTNTTLAAHLNSIRAELHKHYNVLLLAKDNVTPLDVKNSYLGIKEKKIMFLEIFKQYLDIKKAELKVGDLSLKRYQRFDYLYRRCQKFVRTKYKKSDMPLEHIKLHFIEDFRLELRSVDELEADTAMKYAKDLKQITSYAFNHQYLAFDPFKPFKTSFSEPSPKFLSKEEVELVAKIELPTKSLREVRDCFLFSCYTGYAYVDIKSLTPQDVAIGIDGEKWIIRNRAKTKRMENIPLLPIPLALIEKYKNDPFCVAKNQLMPVRSNKHYNDRLKQIRELCGIDKKVSTHVARHTFGTTTTLANGVPIETVKECMGHADLRTTGIYARVTQTKLSSDWKQLKKNLLETEAA